MNMTATQQDEWRTKFELAADQLRELIDFGPSPLVGDKFILKSDYDELQHRLDRARQYATLVDAGEGTDSDPFDDSFDFANDRFFWGLPALDFRHVLEAVVRDQIRAAEALRQTLKKPRDRGAGRIRFLQEMTKWCRCVCGAQLQEVVASTGEVLFDSKAINVRLVQTHTKGL